MGLSRFKNPATPEKGRQAWAGNRNAWHVSSATAFAVSPWHFGGFYFSYASPCSCPAAFRFQSPA
jgi:hypothetical protein